MTPTNRTSIITAEDVVAGGGTFESILERAIRRRFPTAAATATARPSGGGVGFGPGDGGGGVDDRDWFSHHLDYDLFSRTLSFFSERRAGFRARLRRSDENGNVIPAAGAGCGGCGEGWERRLSEEEYRKALDEYARANATFHEEGGILEYAGQRALGREPPGGGRDRRKAKEGGGVDRGGGALNATDIFISAACANVPLGGACANLGDADGGLCSPYVNMEGSSSTMVDGMEITRRLSYLERRELSALLDAEMGRVAAFYRQRMTELSPPREDGGRHLRSSFMCGAKTSLVDLCETGFEGLGCDDSAVDPSISLTAPSDGDRDDILDEHQGHGQVPFSEMGGEILELYAFITTNVIAVRQILLRYDAFARSLGGSPMASWYQTTRRQRKGRLSPDYRDVLNHTELRKLSKAYIQEYTYQRQVSGGGRIRLRALSRGYHRLVDSAEEMKQRQRMKWRQPAMDLDDDKADPEVGRIQEMSRLGGGSGVQARSAETPPRSQRRDIDTPSSSADNYSAAELPPTPLTRLPPLHPNLSREETDDHLCEGEDIGDQVHVFLCILSKTQRSLDKANLGKISGWWDNAVYTLRDYFVVGSVYDNLGLEPSYLTMRGKSLKNNVLVIAQWREQRAAALNESDAGGDSRWFGGFRGELSRETTTVNTPADAPPIKGIFPLGLNILACFLYMMNYYIVEPSSTQYANALGSHDAMSGLIIGAMPFAATSSAIIFSIWSNRCYRTPILVSGVLLAAGNLLYAGAYRRHSMPMALAGRFLTGLGGPRSMNRRYIADTTPLVHRTAVNAAFGTATAMGSALGPATAILLDKIDVEFDLPLYGTVYFNGMTGPGYVMSCLWVIFTIIIALSFSEPERSGLEEQRKREQELEELSSPVHASSIRKPVSFEGGDHIDANNAAASGDPNTQKRTEILNQTTGQSNFETEYNNDESTVGDGIDRDTVVGQIRFVLKHMNLAVWVCMFLLLSKMFTVETVISAASTITKNRYGWTIQKRGTLGTLVGLLTIPISIFIGWVSQYREDRQLMLWLMSFAALGMALLIDVSDFFSTETENYNEGNPFAVGPYRYIAGYILVFCSVQAFDGVVGSMLSKVIPTALASGTLNSGLLATIVGTFGRACGDAFITVVGFINLRQLMNLLFVPSFIILMSDLVLIRWNYDALTA